MMPSTSACADGDIPHPGALQASQSAMSLNGVIEVDAFGCAREDTTAPTTPQPGIQKPRTPGVESHEIRKTEHANLTLGALVVLLTALLFYGSVALLVGKFL